MIQLYQYAISPLLGDHCRFETSCSQYMKESVMQFGILKGFYLGVMRLSRCHPFGSLDKESL